MRPLLLGLLLLLPGCAPSQVVSPGAISALAPALAPDTSIRSLRDFGVDPAKSPADNRAALQSAIDWASTCGGAVWVDPTDEPYPVASGVILRRNTTLLGAHAPVGRGTKHASKPQPVGSVFRIDDADKPFLTVESSTRIEGIQFWYAKQSHRDPAAVITYPPTIQSARNQYTAGVTCRNLSFFGEFTAMDFTATRQQPTELILIEHCYGYPLSGEFVKLDHCYDIPRVLHCHVNPANRRLFLGDCSPAVVDSVIARKTYAFSLDHTDNAQLMDVFTFGTHGGARLGPATYGQLTNFNFDCVTVGVWKSGDQSFNRNWMVAQGSIIANTGNIADIRPFLVDGAGHLAVSNVEAFSGPNGALTVVEGGGRSRDFLKVVGDKRATISLLGCRMRNYEADHPITLDNKNALVILRACLDKNEQLLEATLGK